MPHLDVTPVWNSKSHIQPLEQIQIAYIKFMFGARSLTL